MTGRGPSLDHLIALTDDVGILQHAIHDIPNRAEGYCTDDVARALIVATLADNADVRRLEARRLSRIYLSFLLDAQRPDGRFRNFMSYARDWLDELGSPDSNGRAMWALGIGTTYAPIPAWRAICRERLERAIPVVAELEHPRALAYAALGLTAARVSMGGTSSALDDALRFVAADLTARYATHAESDWDWFEQTMTYDNARLPEALIRIGHALGDANVLAIGLRTLRWYEAHTVEHGVLVPVGNAGWSSRGGRRARYGQQPLEAAAVVDAGLAAFEATGDPHWRELATVAVGWFSGRNTRRVVLARDGGCCDGLEELGLNRNMGAESTLAYLASALAVDDVPREVGRIAR